MSKRSLSGVASLMATDSYRALSRGPGSFWKLIAFCYSLTSVKLEQLIFVLYS